MTPRPMTARPVRALALAALVAAAAPAAHAAEKAVDAGKIFVRYDAYLALPPAERSHIVMAYYLMQGDKPLAVAASLVDGGVRTPLPIRADGKVLKLPTAAQLATAKVAFALDASAKINLIIGMEPAVAPAADLDARELAAAVAQAAPAAKKIAGLTAFAVPTPKAVRFVDVPSGEAELADGRRVALPMLKGAPAYDPAALPNVRRIHLPKVPRKLDLD